MTLVEYIEAITSSKIANDSKKKIVIDLFFAAGTHKRFAEDTANSWLSGERRCKTSRYFPDGRINNEDGFIAYFRNRPEASRKALQEAFRSINTDNIVKCDTNDRDEFCRSLLYQFMSILGIPWPEKAISDTLAINESPVSPPGSCRDEVISQTEDTLLDEVEVGSTSQNETISELMLKIFKQAIEKYNIAGFMNSDELAPSRMVFDFVDEIKSKVLYQFVGSQKEWMYEKIHDFTLKLESYNHILTMVRQSYREIFYLINEKEESLNDFEKSVLPFRQLVGSLYSEICDGETLFVY